MNPVDLAVQAASGMKPINWTVVYVLAGVGVFFALLITGITYAVIPATKVDHDTGRRKSNIGVRLAITFVVLCFSLLICGSIGWSQGKDLATCWANPKFCAGTTAMGMAIDDIFGRS